MNLWLPGLALNLIGIVAASRIGFWAGDVGHRSAYFGC